MKLFKGDISVYQHMLVAFLTLSASQLNAAESEFSLANQLLFTTDHLATIQEQATLVYEFSHDGSQTEQYEDSIEAEIVNIREEGGKDIEVSLFSGERERYVPAFQNNFGNPLITILLQRDVTEMGNQTEGSWRYFHKQIKLALQDDASVEDVQLEIDGKQVEGKRIYITPYRNDAHSNQLGAFADKYYTFTLSDSVPGYVYQIAAITPGDPGEAKKAVFSSDVLTYKMIRSVAK